MDRAKFEAVFRDSHVVDVDFSMWDQSCRIVVVAMEETAFPVKRMPVYQVDFLGARHIGFDFGHWNTQLAQGHFQWNIDDVDLQEEGQLLTVRMAGSGYVPVTTIVCADIRIEHIDNDILDRLFPGWNKPGAPLARPGIIAMAARSSQPK